MEKLNILGLRPNLIGTDILIFKQGTQNTEVLERALETSELYILYLSVLP